MQFRTAFLKLKNIEILRFFFPPFPLLRQAKHSELACSQWNPTDLACYKDTLPLVDFNHFPPLSMNFNSL